MFTRFIKSRPVLLSSVAAIALLGASVTVHQVEFASAAPAALEEPAVTVSVRTIDPEDVRVWSAFSGRLNAVDAANIRPEVSGRLTQILFKDGQTVKAGDPLFVIDPRPYEAQLAKAKADLVSARANVALAQSQFARAASLLKKEFVSKSTYDRRANARNIALANVQVAEAAVSAAQIDVDHAHVKAPISGRISRAEITLGNLVQAGAGAPVLASIVSDDGIYADFEVDEQTYIKSIHANAETHAKEQTIPVELKVEGDETHVYKGSIYSFDNKIDTNSGTIRARARFDNADGWLVPGMFVSVSLGSSVAHDALLVPERAVSSDQSKRVVYVVGNDNKATSREVQLGQQVGNQRIVLAGLHGGDRVIVDGLQHVKPGDTVQIQNTLADAAKPQQATVKVN
jgi:multidrug efflux system membrane fusion protein